MVESTVRNTVAHVVQAFRENNRPDPTKDEDGEPSRFLSRLFRSFKNEDPQSKQQKAIPAVVLRELAKMRLTETQIAIRELAIGAYFFACRSCEYLKVPAAEKKKTNILRLRDIRFSKNGIELFHNNPQLELADSVSLTFTNQKNGIKNDRVTHQRTNDILFCPVRTFAKIMKRIRSYAGSLDNTPISAVWRHGKIDHISSKEMTIALRNAVEAYGETKLGINREDIGTHSLRSGSAMAMYLGECPVYVIMMIGRWSSDAFLVYIRKQIEQFSHGVSSKMLRFQFHRHVSDDAAPSRRFAGDNERVRRSHPDKLGSRWNITGMMAQLARETPSLSMQN